MKTNEINLPSQNTLSSKYLHIFSTHLHQIHREHSKMSSQYFTTSNSGGIYLKQRLYSFSNNLYSNFHYWRPNTKVILENFQLLLLSMDYTNTAINRKAVLAIIQLNMVNLKLILHMLLYHHE